MSPWEGNVVGQLKYLIIYNQNFRIYISLHFLNGAGGTMVSINENFTFATGFLFLPNIVYFSDNEFSSAEKSWK